MTAVRASRFSAAPAVDRFGSAVAARAIASVSLAPQKSPATVLPLDKRFSFSIRFVATRTRGVLSARLLHAR